MNISLSKVSLLFNFNSTYVTNTALQEHNVVIYKEVTTVLP